MKEIRDMELAWKYLNEWCEVTSEFCNDGMVMARRMQRLKVRTEKLIGGDDEKNMGKG